MFAIIGLLAILLQQTPTLLVAQVLDKESAGRAIALWRVPFALYLVPVAVGAVYAPRLFAKNLEGEAAYWIEVRQYLAVMAAASISVALLLQPFVPFIVRRIFHFETQWEGPLRVCLLQVPLEGLSYVLGDALSAHDRLVGRMLGMLSGLVAGGLVMSLLISHAQTIHFPFYYMVLMFQGMTLLGLISINLYNKALWNE